MSFQHINDNIYVYSNPISLIQTNANLVILKTNAAICNRNLVIFVTNLIIFSINHFIFKTKPFIFRTYPVISMKNPVVIRIHYKQNKNSKKKLHCKKIYLFVKPIPFTSWYVEKSAILPFSPLFFFFLLYLYL